MSGQEITTFFPQEQQPSSPRSGHSQQTRLPPSTKSCHQMLRHLHTHIGGNPFSSQGGNSSSVTGQDKSMRHHGAT